MTTPDRDARYLPVPSPDRRPLTVGVVGTGFMGHIHARAALVNGATLVGVSASTPDRAARAAGPLGAARAYRSSADLISDPDIEVVHICTPNHLHAELARMALDAGKHVICEKPLATNIADAVDLHQRARHHGLVGTVPFVFRYYPMAREARERLRSGRIGHPTLIHGAYLQDWLAGEQSTNWRVDPLLGGPSRTFADIGSHWCDLAEFLTGDRIVEVAAHFDTVIARRPDPVQRQATFSAPSDSTDRAGDGGAGMEVTTEDTAVVQFRTAGGAGGSLVASQVAAGHKNHLGIEVIASAGAVTFDSRQLDTLRLVDHATTRILDRDPVSLSAAAASLSHLPPGHPQGYQDCVDAFVGDSYRAVQDRSSSDTLPTFASGVRTAAITDAVVRAAGEHRWVAVPEGVGGERD